MASMPTAATARSRQARFRARTTGLTSCSTRPPSMAAGGHERRRADHHAEFGRHDRGGVPDRQRQRSRWRCIEHHRGERSNARHRRAQYPAQSAEQHHHFTPDAGYTGPASFSYTISDGRGGTATANVNFTVAPAGAAPVSLFSASNTPAQTNLNDGAQLEVGMKFTSSVAGQITALKFYRSASDTGTDVLDLWTATGTILGSATFTNTAASGWQTVTLPSAVSIAANTTYVASYHTTGAYVATNNYFTTRRHKRPPDRAFHDDDCRRQRRLCLWRHRHDRHLPDQHLWRRQLLGRCRVHAKRRRQHRRRRRSPTPATPPRKAASPTARAARPPPATC